jgi:muramoyltetrapeptide carboxypeptidase
MSKMTPLRPGNEIRVIAPSSSRRKGRERYFKHAQERLEAAEYAVTFGKAVDKTLHLGTARAEDRANDFNEAYLDKNVRAVIAMHGGWAANEILSFIDWEIVRTNPKPLFGSSDITVLLNAIYAKTGIVTYLGPTYTDVGSARSWQYTLDSLNAALRGEVQMLKQSKIWSDWSEKKGHRTKAWKVVQPGKAEGILLGGNMSTFYLLQGTQYQPQFDKEFVLALEDDDQSGKYTPYEFSRRLESLLQLPNARENLRGIIIGRFQPSCKFTDKELEDIIATKKLPGVPIVSRVDFGHTLPMVSLPIGGKLRIDASSSVLTLTASKG